MSRVFVISDHHFGHQNIIDFESRPFATAEEMDEYMINQWNEIVEKEDKVFHLGDFSFYNKEKTKAIVQRLHGKKFLILGNHDRGRSKAWWLDAGFEEVSEYPIIYGGFYLLSHEPMYMNKHMPYVNVHGHIHGQKYEGKHYFNACVEHWDYKPVDFEAIRSSLAPNEEQQ
ncbi:MULTISPECIES: metallophosphoesterase family protein [Paenibacillus]|uniref:Metallophosphoesterase n=1 Tax=Paenibacillus albilobatus TaxID=2716884 RepID=A0A919XH00_9BACL|nr:MULTISPECIES: metallophosphoesterase family protein [Paenibacillus]GIO30780.1 metallophosphoesterase [Paenibacillus albilobatus]